MNWVLDPSHTSLQFAVKHMGVFTVRGRFKKVRGTAETDGDGLRAGATAFGKVNRKEWGLNWNQVLELGALLVGEEVHFTLDAQAVSEVAAPVAA